MLTRAAEACAATDLPRADEGFGKYRSGRRRAKPSESERGPSPTRKKKENHWGWRRGPRPATARGLGCRAARRGPLSGDNSQPHCNSVVIVALQPASSLPPAGRAGRPAHASSLQQASVGLAGPSAALWWSQCSRRDHNHLRTSSAAIGARSTGAARSLAGRRRPSRSVGPRGSAPPAPRARRAAIV